MYTLGTLELIVIKAYCDLVHEPGRTLEEKTRLLDSMILFSRCIRTR